MPAYDTMKLTPRQRVSTFVLLPKAKASGYSVTPGCIPHFLAYYSPGLPLTSSQLSRDILSWLLTQKLESEMICFFPPNLCSGSLAANVMVSRTGDLFELGIPVAWV